MIGLVLIAFAFILISFMLGMAFGPRTLIEIEIYKVLREIKKANGLDT